MFRLVFFFFLLFFFGHAQADVVAYLWSCLLGRPAELWPWLPALLLATLFTGLADGCGRVFRRRKIPPFAGYVLAAWLSAMLVSQPFVTWRWPVAWGVTGGALIAGEHLWEKHLHHIWPDARTLWQRFMPATVKLLALCLFIGIGAGATDVEHYELHTAEALRTGHPQRAYKVGEVAIPTSPRLFAMRCYLLTITDKKGLGEAVFQQPVPPGGSRHLLFPADRRQALLLPADSLSHLLGGTRRPGETVTAYFHRCAEDAFLKEGAKRNEKPVAAIDYYLTALLLDRRLDDFARETARFYPRRVAQGKLPTYFAQALFFHMRQRSQPAVRYHDSAIEENYHNYTEMADTIADARIRKNLLRRSYGETYWWWYEYDK